jgi:predicted kinase
LVYINRDDIRGELLGDVHEQSRNKEIWEEANRRTRASLLDGKGVVLDSCFAEEWKRRDAIKFLRESGAERVIGLYFNVPEQVARERNSKRQKPVKDEAMSFMRDKFASEPPSLGSGFDGFYTHTELELFQNELIA